MPEAEYVWLPREDILSFEEISTLTDLFTTVGVNKVRLTGGEPLLRKNLPDLIRELAAKPAIQDLALTTNGILLADRATTLQSAGLNRITISLDTLKPDRFKALTRFDELAAVLSGLNQAVQTWVDQVKIDSVIIRGVNDDELIDLLEYGRYTMDIRRRRSLYRDAANNRGQVWHCDTSRRTHICSGRPLSPA